MPPPESDTIVIRWPGNANYEFAYKSKAYLFDTYFNRTPRSHDLGFTADVKKATAIFIGRSAMTVPTALHVVFFDPKP
jgi:hypothetical protein